jgi:hypothetical protein
MQGFIEIEVTRDELLVETGLNLNKNEPFRLTDIM